MADLTDLYNEISSEAPCGADLEYDSERIALDNSIQGTPEDQFSGQKYEPPNWHTVQKQALALLKKSKDLQVTLYLIRALIHLEGIAGFRDGLNYLQHSVNGHWDLIYPRLDPDDGDATQRLNILEELCHRELVLNPLSQSILAESKIVGRVNLRDIQYATEKLPVPAGSNKPDLNFIKAVFKDNDVKVLAANHQAILETASSLAQIESDVNSKVAGIGNGINLDTIKSLIKDISFNFEQFAGERLAALNVEQAVDKAAEDSPNPDISVKSSARVAGQIKSRQDVIKTLDLICQYYAENEPSSPVPILLQRAKTLATSNFMEVVKNLLPDALAQIEFLKGPESG